MTQEELKERLKTLEFRMSGVKSTIDFKVDELNQYKNVYSELMRSYMNLDRKLALLDGRFKLIEIGASGQKKITKKTASQIMAKMTPERRLQLYEDLKEGGG
ncbi:hypothetical protein LCGC14_1882330 [marine sediment metagenome]|uniref:Uncharacterized protein n=1 Tax=marine sediment metagenome TaxID=412755 RepID=A0A0F9J0A0_9ZZZZ